MFARVRTRKIRGKFIDAVFFTVNIFPCLGSTLTSELSSEATFYCSVHKSTELQLTWCLEIANKTSVHYNVTLFFTAILLPIIR